MAHRIWLQFMFVFLSANQGLCQSYAASFITEIESCKNFKNNKFDASNIKLAQKDENNEDGPGIMCLKGSIDLRINIDETVVLTVITDKDTAVGQEHMMTSVVTLCQYLEDKRASWAPIVQKMGIEHCPVTKGMYNVSNLCLDFDFLNAMLSDKTVGEYRITIQMTSPQWNNITCYEVSISIYER